MERPKLLALDMDGTLLNSRKEISPRTLRTLEALSAAGIHVVAATGRGPAEMTEILEQMPFMRYGVLASGAMICDFRRSDALRIRALRTEKIAACLDACLAGDAMPHFLTVRDSVVRADQVGHLADYHHGDHQAAFERICVRAEDMGAYARAHPGEILKVCMYHRSTDSRLRSLAALQGRDLCLTFAGKTSLEAVAPGLNKGEGLQALAAYLGLRMDECAAVGDDINDLEMLRMAGRSAAMGNAPEQVKREARLVTADNDHDGAAEAAEVIFWDVLRGDLTGAF